MAGTGSVEVTSVSKVGTIELTHQYDVAVRFNIAFNYGGWNNSGASYTINCDGQSQSGTATFSVSSGGGSYVWTTIATKTFRITMPSSGQSKTINFSAGINTGVKPSYISASGSYTLSAVTWEWTVSYNANGGSGAPTSQTKTYGTNLTLSSTRPTRTGYTFLGWSTSSTATSASYSPGGTYTSNSGATLYAVWKINTFTVSYNANGGSGAPSSQTKTYGTNLTLSSTIPTRTNYNFKGWATSSTATSAIYAAGGIYTANEAVTLYAVWELAYWNPKITSVSVTRCNYDGTLNNYGAYAMATFNWECCQITGANNIKSITIQYAISTSASYTSTLLSASGISGSVSEVFGSGNLSIDNQYDVRITIVDDKGGSTTQTTVLSGAEFTIDFLSGGKGVAVGKPAEMENTFDVNWDTHIRKTLWISGSTDNDSGNLYLGTRNFSGNSWINSENWWSTGETYKGLLIYARQTRWKGLCQEINATVGEIYTFSAYVKVSDKATARYIITNYCGNSTEGLASVESLNYDFTLEDSDFVRVFSTWRITESGIICPGVELYSEGATIYVAGFKLEKSSIKTEWSPSPKDAALHVSNGNLTYDIQVNQGDANNILTSGKYYMGTLATNKPGGGQNGWLEVQASDIIGTYCYQKYVAYTGEKYERWRNDGVWGEWCRVDRPILTIASSYNTSLSHTTNYGVTHVPCNVLIYQSPWLKNSNSLYMSGGSIKIGNNVSTVQVKGYFRCNRESIYVLILINETIIDYFSGAMSTYISGYATNFEYVLNVKKDDSISLYFGASAPLSIDVYSSRLTVEVIG